MDKRIEEMHKTIRLGIICMTIIIVCATLGVHLIYNLTPSADTTVITTAKDGKTVSY